MVSRRAGHAGWPLTSKCGLQNVRGRLSSIFAAVYRVPKCGHRTIKRIAVQKKSSITKFASFSVWSNLRAAPARETHKEHERKEFKRKADLVLPLNAL